MKIEVGAILKVSSGYWVRLVEEIKVEGAMWPYYRAETLRPSPLAGECWLYSSFSFFNEDSWWGSDEEHDKISALN